MDGGGGTPPSNNNLVPCPRGYDVYTPHRSIVFHDYDHGVDTAKASSWSRKGRDLQRSNDRLRTLLGKYPLPCSMISKAIQPTLLIIVRGLNILPLMTKRRIDRSRMVLVGYCEASII